MFILQSDKRPLMLCSLSWFYTLTLGLCHTIGQATIMAVRTEPKTAKSSMASTVYRNFLYHNYISKQPFHNNQLPANLIKSHSADISHKMTEQ